MSRGGQDVSTSECRGATPRRGLAHRSCMWACGQVHSTHVRHHTCAEYACVSSYMCTVQPVWAPSHVWHVHHHTCALCHHVCALRSVWVCASMRVHHAECVCVPSRVCTVCSSATRVWAVQGAGDVCPGATAETPAGRGLRGPLQAAPEPQTASGVLVPGRPHLRQAGGGDGAGSPQGAPCVSAQSGRGLIPGAWHPHVGRPACQHGRGGGAGWGGRLLAPASPAQAAGVLPASPRAGGAGPRRNNRATFRLL